MIEFKQKQLREMVKLGIAVDISDGTHATRERLIGDEIWLTQVGFSHGVYGCNDKLLQGHKSGKLYAVIGRGLAMFIF